MKNNLRASFREAKNIMFLGLGLVPLSPLTASAQSTPDVCLALVTDVSGSVTGDKYGIGLFPEAQAPLSGSAGLPTDNEYQLQKFGTAQALRSDRVIKTIVDNGGVGLVYIEFSDEPIIKVPFKVVRTPSEINGYADQIGAVRRDRWGYTAIGRALKLAIEELTKDCDGSRLVIDISGDGHNNRGPSSEKYRDVAERLGITINGLPIVNPGPYGEPYNVETYRTTVITHDGLLVEATEGFSKFKDAMERKMFSELANLRPDSENRPTLHLFAGNTAASLKASPEPR